MNSHTARHKIPQDGGHTDLDGDEIVICLVPVSHPDPTAQEPLPEEVE